MATQLALLDTNSPAWKLDRRTREIGRRGVAQAREALRRADAAPDARHGRLSRLGGTHMTKRRMLGILVALLAAAVAAAAATTGGSADAGRPGDTTVVRVVDGDTIVARLPSGEERVRLIGIDTPESVDPRAPVECFGKEASARTAALLPEGTAIRLERDVEGRDRYGRLLAYVYRADDGTFVNLALAEEGYAQPLSIPPNVAYASRFSAAAAAAREAGRGLWSACR